MLTQTPTEKVKALLDLAEQVLIDWLSRESPIDKRKQKALELVAEAGQCLHVACINLGLYDDLTDGLLLLFIAQCDEVL